MRDQIFMNFTYSNLIHDSRLYRTDLRVHGEIYFLKHTIQYHTNSTEPTSILKSCVGGQPSTRITDGTAAASLQPSQPLLFCRWLIITMCTSAAPPILLRRGAAPPCRMLSKSAVVQSSIGRARFRREGPASCSSRA